MSTATTTRRSARRRPRACSRCIPNLKVIVAPTTVGIVAAAQVVRAAKLTGKVFVTGLGTPKGMQDYVKGGEAPEFALWNVTDLGYLAYAVAADLVNGTIKGTEGETFTVAGLNGDQPYTIGKDSVVVLGPPFVFNKTNIDQFVASVRLLAQAAFLEAPAASAAGASHPLTRGRPWNVSPSR